MSPLKSTLLKIFDSLPRVPSSNYRYRSFDVNPYALLPRNPVILDIASKNSRGAYGFGAPPPDAKLICVDIEPGEGVDIVADAHHLPLVASGSVDCVCCVSFLYAARHPDQVVREIHRILKPGGVFYVSVPYVFPRCSDPGDFYRFSYTGLEVLCEDFERLDAGFNRGPASTMHELIVRFLAMLLSFNSTALYAVWRYLLRWPLFWVKYLDSFMARYKMASEIYSGAYFIGRKAGYDPMAHPLTSAAVDENHRPATEGFPQPAVVYTAKFRPRQAG